MGEIKQSIIMVRRLAFISTMLVCTACLPGIAQEKAPRELLQYVNDAQKAGISATKIQENAVSAGWPAALVTDALSQIKVTEKANPGESAPKPAEVASQPADSTGNQPLPAPPASTDAPVAALAGSKAPSPASVMPTVPEVKAASITKPPINPSAGIPEDYEIGAGDVLKITVWHEPDASLPNVVVPPNGKISMPLLHDVEVAGMKVPDLEKHL